MNKPTFEIKEVTFESEKWKEEFDEQFNNINVATVIIESTLGTVSQSPAQDRLKDFISNLLDQQKKELAEKVDTELRRVLAEELPKLEEKIISQTEQECDKKWGEKALGNEKLLKDIHRLELDAISCMSLEKFMKWSDDRKEKSKTEALQDLLNNK